MQQDFITSGNRRKPRLTESLSSGMAGGLVRVAVLLCAVAAVTRAQTWHSHGDPPGTWILPALVPLTQYNGNIWFGVSSDGPLYERYHDTGVWYWRTHGIPISAGKFPVSYGEYHEEPCALEGENEIHLMGTDGKLFGRYLSPYFGWSTTHHGSPFGADFLYASGCSSVKKPALKARTFMRGTVGQGAANGYLFELQEVGPAVWEWRWHSRPFDRSGSTYVANIKTTSYLRAPNGLSFVFVVGTDGNMWQLFTHQDGRSRWRNLGKPAGKTIRHIHATRFGLWWAITTDGSVCRFHGGWPCFSLAPYRFVRDCSDPFYVGNGVLRQVSMFCITDDILGSWTPENRLYQLTVDNWGSGPATWVDHGIPASNQYYYVDRPNVAFLANPSWPVDQTPRSVFVPSTEGVYELRIP